MKKLVLISTIMATFASLSAFGQGYFQFATAKSQVYDGFSTGVAHASSSVDVAFLWAASGAVPEVSSILSSVPTTATTGNTTWTTTAAWSAILSDPNFTLAVEFGNAVRWQVATTTAGAISYNGGGAFGGPLTTSPAPYTLFMIGWNGAYATPALASAAGAAVGWSSAFNYTPLAASTLSSSMSGSTAQLRCCRHRSGTHDDCVVRFGRSLASGVPSPEIIKLFLVHSSPGAIRGFFILKGSRRRGNEAGPRSRSPGNEVGEEGAVGADVRRLGVPDRRKSTQTQVS